MTYVWTAFNALAAMASVAGLVAAILPRWSVRETVDIAREEFHS